MPGVRWLPAAGRRWAGDNPEVHPTDFYQLDLTVDLPEGLAGGRPGQAAGHRCRASTESGRNRFRFAPEGPLPEVALVAGRFESRSTEIEGVTLEMLARSHSTLANLEYFEDSTAEIEDWLTEKLQEAANVGLDYPYDALTMVEIPNTLRGYGGGWRMDSTLIQPAMILMREAGFPTANFKRVEDRFQARQGRGGRCGAGEASCARTPSSRTTSTAGTRSSADGAELLRLPDGRRRPRGRPAGLRLGKSDQRTGDRAARLLLRPLLRSGLRSGVRRGRASDAGRRTVSATTTADVLVHNIVSTNKVWDTVVDVSLLELDPDEDPERAINVLSLKGGAMAQSMLDDLGREKTGQFLAALRESHRAVVSTRATTSSRRARAVEADLEEWLALWIEQTDLPGFRIGDVRYHRLADAEDGAMQYQLLVTVRNGESAPGLARLEYRIESEQQGFRWQRAEPFTVSGRTAPSRSA